MNLDTGAARIRQGHRTGTKVHAMRPPVGEGLVCDPTIPIERLEAADGEIDCKVCLSQINHR